MIYKKEAGGESPAKGIREEYNLLEISKHMEESMQAPKAPARAKLKKTLEKKSTRELTKSILYSKKPAKASQRVRKREPRNVSSFSRMESKSKGNLSIENRKRRRNISSKVVPRKKPKSKPRKRRKKSQVILNNIDNSQNVYNNYFINVKDTPTGAGLEKMDRLLHLINGSSKQSQRKEAVRAEAPVSGYMEDARKNKESRFLEESTQRLKNSIISVRQIFEENSQKVGVT